MQISIGALSLIDEQKLDYYLNLLKSEFEVTKETSFEYEYTSGKVKCTRCSQIFEIESKAKNVEVMTEFKLSKIEENGVFVVGNDIEEKFVEAERIVITIGNRPDNKLYNQIKSLGYEIHRIGDCLEPRSAKSAIYEGAVLGRAI